MFLYFPPFLFEMISIWQRTIAVIFWQFPENWKPGSSMPPVYSSTDGSHSQLMNLDFL